MSDAVYVLDRCWTRKGRAKFGVQEPTLRQKLTLALAPPDTKTKVVEGLREMMLATKLPHPARWAPMNAASQKVFEASRPFSDVWDLIFDNYGETEEWVYNQRQVCQVCYRAVARALEHRDIPARLNTDDLISPITGKPVTYSFDGSVILVSGGQRQPHRFVVKPD